MIPLLFSPGECWRGAGGGGGPSLGSGHVFDGKDVIGASVIAPSSRGQTAHMMSDRL